MPLQATAQRALPGRVAFGARAKRAPRRSEVRVFMRQRARRHPPFLRAVAADTRCAYAQLGRPLAKASRVRLLGAASWLAATHDGFVALVAYRAKARLQGLGVPLLPRVAQRLAIVLGQVAIGDPVIVEPGIYLPHGHVVIDGFVRIGAGSAIRPFVTIGLREADPQGPTIGRKVLIGTGAKILGAVKIGNGARVGANSLVLDDVPERATAVGVPAKIVRRDGVTALRDETVQARKLRRQASIAEAEGRLNDAVSLLTELNRVRADPEVEERLASLRCRAAAQAPKAPRTAPAPTAPVGDPFPDVIDDVPEIASHELSVDLLRGALAHHGSLLVRGLIDRRFVDTLTTATDRAFAAREDAGAIRPWYVPCEAWDELSGGSSHTARKWSRDCNTVQLVDAPRALAQIVEAFDAVDLPDLISAYLGESILWSANKTTLRRVPPDANASWHQDGYFMGPSVRAVDVWVALGACGPGTGAPGIAIVPRRVDRLLEAGGRGAPLKTALSVADVERAGGGVIVAPTFEPGDALLLDEHTVHATDGSKPGWTRSRYALEAWAFAASTFAESYVPFVV